MDGPSLGLSRVVVPVDKFVAIGASASAVVVNWSFCHAISTVLARWCVRMSGCPAYVAELSNWEAFLSLRFWI